MKRFGQIIKIKQEGLEIYKRYRKNLWPEVNQKLKTCNIRNYYISER
jgi:L-rhamnose mutarotase